MPVTQLPQAVRRPSSAANLPHRKLFHAMAEPRVHAAHSLILHTRKMSLQEEELLPRVPVSYKRCVPQSSQGGNLSLLPSLGCHLCSVPTPMTGVQTVAAWKLRIKVERDSLRMCYRKSFADITQRGCSTLGQFSGTEGETKAVGFLDSESQLLGSLQTMSPQMLEES